MQEPFPASCWCFCSWRRSGLRFGERLEDVLKGVTAFVVAIILFSVIAVGMVVIRS